MLVRRIAARIIAADMIDDRDTSDALASWWSTGTAGTVPPLRR